MTTRSKPTRRLSLDHQYFVRLSDPQFDDEICEAASYRIEGGALVLLDPIGDLIVCFSPGEWARFGYSLPDRP